MSEGRGDIAVAELEKERSNQILWLCFLMEERERCSIACSILFVPLINECAIVLDQVWHAEKYGNINCRD